MSEKIRINIISFKKCSMFFMPTINISFVIYLCFLCILHFLAEFRAAPQGQAYKVHYIEDNETNVEVMRGVLGLRPQVALTVSELGLDGLQAVRRDRPDLILLDMHLPDVDGLELLHQLQRDSRLAAIPVVVVSADATTGRVAQVLAAGARHYLTKPVELAPFLAVLDELLAARQTHPH